MIEDDEEQFREGSDAVLFEKPGILHGVLTFSRDGLRGGEKERKRKRTRLYGAWVLIGGWAQLFGLSCVIMSLHHIMYKP
jgi:hypothetical protein